MNNPSVTEQSVGVNASAPATGSAPDKVGYWWWRGHGHAGHTGWELVEAREIYKGDLRLHSMERNWGGFTLEMARTLLPGKWIYIPRPDEALNNH